MISLNDRSVARGLAARWMELASRPVMTERKRLWKAVHDLKAERPVILFETAWIDGFVADGELVCEDPFLRSVERTMRVTLRQAEELGDDLVVEPYYRLGWKMRFSDYGVPVEVRSSMGKEALIAYTFSREHLAGHVQGVCSALSGQAERAIRPDLLRVLRTGRRPPGDDHRCDPQSQVRLHFGMVEPGEER